MKFLEVLATLLLVLAVAFTLFDILIILVKFRKFFMSILEKGFLKTLALYFILVEVGLVVLTILIFN